MKSTHVFFKLWCISLVLAMPCATNAQDMASQLAIIPENKVFYAGIDNPFRIVAAQAAFVEAAQVKVYFAPYDSVNFEEVFEPLALRGGPVWFNVNLPALGTLRISVAMKDTVYHQQFHVYPVTAVCRLGRYGADYKGKIKPAEFKLQKGILCIIECCGFDARCSILDYQVIRISGDKVQRCNNRGAAFGTETRALIDQASPGDVYIFRNISYRCPNSSTKPLVHQDLIFELE
jgi:hypothetical protein